MDMKLEERRVAGEQRDRLGQMGGWEKAFWGKEARQARGGGERGCG